MASEPKSGTVELNKLFRFEGMHFRRWKQKMFFYLTTKKLDSICETEKPIFFE
ncbi:hypothetical protein LguiA_033667 [Lonicera macranthoides]